MVKDEVTPCYIIKLCPLAFARLPHEISYYACVPFHIDRKKGICLRYRAVQDSVWYCQVRVFYSRLRISSMFLTSFLRENALMLYFKLTEKIRLSALFVSTDLRLA